MSVTEDEFRRQRALRRELREMDQRMRLDNERAVRLVLDRQFPEGIPADLLESICLIQNTLIKQIVQDERTMRELHDGINRVSDEAAQREVAGFDECARQVRLHAEELGISPPVVDSLLRNHHSVQDRRREEAERNRAATQQVEWSRS